MSRLNILLVSLTALAALAACQSISPPPEAQTAEIDAACLVSSTNFPHIWDRHCSGGSGNQLLGQYCGSPADAQRFCRLVQNANAASMTRIVDGSKIQYDANLGIIVGTRGEKCGRLVIVSQSNGIVVTEFPEFGNAPGTCW